MTDSTQANEATRKAEAEIAALVSAWSAEHNVTVDLIRHHKGGTVNLYQRRLVFNSTTGRECMTHVEMSTVQSPALAAISVGRVYGIDMHATVDERGETVKREYTVGLRV